MNPLVTFIIAALIKYGPKVAREIYALFQVGTPTLADFEKVFALADKSYEDYTGPISETQAVFSQAVLDALKAAQHGAVPPKH